MGPQSNRGLELLPNHLKLGTHKLLQYQRMVKGAFLGMS